MILYSHIFIQIAILSFWSYDILKYTIINHFVKGVVQSVSFNIFTKDLMYKIVYKDEKDIVEEVTQDKLAYAAGCQVTIASDKEDGSDVDGTVLLCEPSPTGLVYTVMTTPVEGFQANYEAGVDAKRVKYRRVKSIDTTTDDNKAEGVAVEKDAAAKSVPKVPLSITCDSNNSKDGTTLCQHRQLQLPRNHYTMHTTVVDPSLVHHRHPERRIIKLNW